MDSHGEDPRVEPGAQDPTVEPRKVERVGGRLLLGTSTFMVRRDIFRDPEGGTVERDLVVHPGSVAMVAHHGNEILLVAQPREAVGEADLLEIPAGTRDRERETALECAQRELAEEVGVAAGDWEEGPLLYPSPGYTTETCQLYFATELYEVESPPGSEERIETVRVRLDELDELIPKIRDAVTVVGLMLLRDRLRARGRAL